MPNKLTEEYLKAHLSENNDHYNEVGRLISNAIMQDAIEYVRKNGSSEIIQFSANIELIANDEEGCVIVRYTRDDGSVLTYHRPT